MHERLFRVRAVAFLVDLLTYYFAAALVALTISMLTPVEMLIPSFFDQKSCQELRITGANPILEAMKPPENAEPFVKRCVVRQMLVNQVHTYSFGYTFVKDGFHQTRKVSFAADEAGDTIPVIDMSAIIDLFLPFVTASFLARRGATPGKRLFYLAVQTKAREKPTYRRALARELIRFAPFVVNGLFAIPFALIAVFADPLDMVEILRVFDVIFSEMGVHFFALLAVSAVIWFWFWFGSFIRWRGQAYWDRITGLYVYDVGDESILAR